MSRPKIWLNAFFAAVAADLIAIVQDLEQIRFISKSVLMPLLIVYAVFRFKEKDITFKLLLGGLFFSWLGDLFLLFGAGSEKFFILGLLAFLIAHISYIITYHKSRDSNAELGLLRTQEMRYLFIILMAGFAVIYILYPALGAMKLPVIVYASALVYMLISALYRYGRTTTQSFTLVFIGAILFMVSDSMLAFNKFMEAFSGAGFWIMLTYCIAQLMIVEGIASHAIAAKD